MDKVLRYGYRYEIKDPDSKRYRYAEPVAYADGCQLGDCWIVDAKGNVDPGYSASPTPFQIDSLKNPRKV